MSSIITNLRPVFPTIGLYTLLVYVFSSIIYISSTISDRNGGDFTLHALPIMYIPAIAAYLTLRYNGRSIRELKWSWPTCNYVLLSWYVPIIYSLGSYLIVWTTGLGGFPNHDFLEGAASRLGLNLSPTTSAIIYTLIYGTFGMIPAVSSAVGEEIGWRGFLIPELVKSYSFTTASLYTGIIWSIWHWPLIITTSSYSSTAPWLYKITCFTISVTALSFTMTWIRLKSSSLWAPAIVHGSHNLYVQGFLTPLTVNTGNTAYYIDEFGCVLCVTSVITAIYFWRRRGEVEGNIRLPLVE